jgi:hypothetical protein
LEAAVISVVAAAMFNAGLSRDDSVFYRSKRREQRLERAILQFTLSLRV